MVETRHPDQCCEENNQVMTFDPDLASSPLDYAQSTTSALPLLYPFVCVRGVCARVCSECAGVTVTLHGTTQYCVFRSHISHHQRCLHPNSTAVITGGRGLGPVVSPPSWNNRKHCIIFPPLHSFSTLIEKYIASCLALSLHTTPCCYSIQNVFVGVCYAALFLWEQRLCFCNDTIRGILPRHICVFSFWLIYEYFLYIFSMRILIMFFEKNLKNMWLLKQCIYQNSSNT